MARPSAHEFACLRSDRRALSFVNRVANVAHGLNELRVADFSYLRCWEGVVFFSFVIDVYSRKVVGWQFAAHMRATLVLDALQMGALQQASRR